jgi:hypothetical protein
VYRSADQNIVNQGCDTGRRGYLSDHALLCFDVQV